jgi:DNA-binding PadR family transcriptional regulator
MDGLFMNGMHIEVRFPLNANGRFSGFRGGGRGWHHGHRGGGMGGGGLLRAGRMLTSADLQLLLLALLEERPRHGYDLIKSIQELAGGAYVPSPGMVYPALNYLEELGQISSQPDGVKKQYRLTASGLATLDESRARVSLLFDDLKRAGLRLGKAREAYERSEGDSAAMGQSPSVTLEAARRDLKAALFDSLDESPEEQQRIAEILQRTIAEIRKNQR